MPEPVELPHTRSGFIIGSENPHGMDLRLTWDGEQTASRFSIPSEKTGFSGIVHGGVLAAILDEVMGWAPTVVKRRMCMAAEITIRFVKPVPTDVPLVAVGRFAKDKRRLWLAKGEIRDEAGTVYVSGKGIFMPLSANESARIEAEFLVYPEGAERLFSQNG